MWDWKKCLQIGPRQPHNFLQLQRGRGEKSCFPWAREVWKWLKESWTWRNPMMEKTGQCKSDLLKFTAKDQKWCCTCNQMPASPPFSIISPTTFWANSGSSSEPRYNSGERGGIWNDWEDLKWLRLRIYYWPEERFDIEIRIGYRRLKKITFFTQLSLRHKTPPSISYPVKPYGYMGIFNMEAEHINRLA